VSKKQRAMNIFPGLAAQMAYHYHDNFKLAEILGISYDSVLRRLNGTTDFELTEVKMLMKAYNTSFEDLFGETRESRTA
jgi:hypothetical protein